MLQFLINDIDRTDKVERTDITDVVNQKDTASFTVSRAQNEPWTYPFVDKGQWIGNLNDRGEWENLAELEAWEQPTDPATLPHWKDYSQIYTASSDNTVRKVDSDGNEVWSFTGHTSIVNGVAVDADGNVYSASNDNTVRKIDSSGNEVWSFTGHSSSVTSVAIDADGNVYSIGLDDTLRKIDAQGNEVWRVFSTFDVFEGVAVDLDGNIYVGDLNRIYKLDNDGNEVWTYVGDASFNDLAVDSSGNVYGAAEDNIVVKVDSDGNKVWTFTGHTGWVNGIAVDIEGNVYSGSNDNTVRKIDSDGNQVWSFTGHTNPVYGIAVDIEGNVYSASWDDTVRKIDSDGNQVWSFTGHSDNVQDVTILSFTLFGSNFYKVGDKVQYDGIAYQCQTDNTLEQPDISNDWEEIAYQEGDKVNHMDQFWQSDTDNNLDEPPTNWTDIGYKTGDEVQHNGSRWACQVDDTTEEPGTGDDWQEVPTYNTNDLVNHQAQRWYSVEDNNTDEPGKTPTWKRTDLAPEPLANDEIIINHDGTRIFGGAITAVSKRATSGTYLEYEVEATDWTHFLDSKIVLERFRNRTVSYMLDFIFDKYDEDGFTLNNVVGGTTIGSMTFNRITLKDCLDKLADALSYSWYVDPHKDIHFFPKNQEPAPFSLTDTSGNYVWTSLSVNKDISQLRNSIIVEGGDERANELTEEFTVSGDEESRRYLRLANRFAEMPVVTVGGSPITVGVEYLDDDQDFDALWSRQEKYIRFTDGNVPSTGTNAGVTGEPLFGVVVEVNEPNSIEDFGTWQFVIRDDSIDSRSEAIQRAFAELQAYQRGIIEAEFETNQPGLRSGQVISINSPIRDVDEDFLIQEVTLQPVSSTVSLYRVRLATLRTIGIIEFLQDLVKEKGVREGESVTLLNFRTIDDEASAEDSIVSITSTSPPYVITDSDGNVTTGTAAKVNFSKLASV